MSCFNTASTGSGSCVSAYAACTTNADCNALKTCLAACGATDSTCQQTCVNAHPNSLDLYNMGPNCICNSGCPVECSAECQQ